MERNRRLKLVALLTGALLLVAAPIQARTNGKTEKRYTIYYKRVAYIHGFDDGYEGKNHNNSFTVETDRLLYEIGFLEGDEACLEEKNRRET